MSGNIVSKELSFFYSVGAFTWVQLHLRFLLRHESLLNILKHFCLIFAFNNHVIDIHLDVPPNLVGEYRVNQVLICCPRNF